ncbi:MAG TPA: NAD-dependent epimerase/dehydratase family protein [Flavobacteriales bacterium]|nr:NAD-dependent epimerase/dehydratase family protein [Flavobacteriales bacterium]
MKNILIIGSNGQIGTDLTAKLRDKYGQEQVWTSDIRDPEIFDPNFVHLDATDRAAVEQVITDKKIDEVYLMAAILSANAEKMPNKAWDINMQALFNVLELGKAELIKKIFWPSSIAVFGPHTPRINTPQYTIMDPNTVYGISKLAGERWIEYYKEHYNVDVRSVRYPGIISWKTLPGGGTTDYAVEIFHEALKNGHYTSFLAANTRLPMMYMPDAIDATIKLMEADADKLSVHSSYNIAGISFTPEQLAKAIRQYIPDFTIDYKPDFRQAIAESWPETIDDRMAFKDWHWHHQYDLDKMVKDMLLHLSEKYHATNVVF